MLSSSHLRVWSVVWRPLRDSFRSANQVFVQVWYLLRNTRWRSFNTNSQKRKTQNKDVCYKVPPSFYGCDLLSSFDWHCPVCLCLDCGPSQICLSLGLIQGYLLLYICIVHSKKGYCLQKGNLSAWCFAYFLCLHELDNSVICFMFVYGCGVVLLSSVAWDKREVVLKATVPV